MRRSERDLLEATIMLVCLVLWLGVALSVEPSTPVVAFLVMGWLVAGCAVLALWCTGMLYTRRKEP